MSTHIQTRTGVGTSGAHHFSYGGVHLMDEKRISQGFGIQRHTVSMMRDCALIDISFQNLECTDSVVRIANLSVTGLGIDSELPLEPGIILFKQAVYGQKFGILVWCEKIEERYRAGIEFAFFSHEIENYLQQQIELLQPNKPLDDPKQIIARLIERIREKQ